jgi:hypothetical protein
MRRALQVSFLFPFPGSSGIDDDGTLGGSAPKFLESPHALYVRQLDIQDTDFGQAVDEQRFGILKTGAMNHPILIGGNTRADRLREIRMGGNDQQSLHDARPPLFSTRSRRFGTVKKDVARMAPTVL